MATIEPRRRLDRRRARAEIVNPIRVEPCICGGSIGVLVVDLARKDAALYVEAAVKAHRAGAVHTAYLDRGGLGESAAIAVPSRPRAARLRECHR